MKWAATSAPSGIPNPNLSDTNIIPFAPGQLCLPVLPAGIGEILHCGT